MARNQGLAYVEVVDLMCNEIRTTERNAGVFLLNVFKDIGLAVNIGKN